MRWVRGSKFGMLNRRRTQEGQALRYVGVCKSYARVAHGAARRALLCTGVIMPVVGSKLGVIVSLEADARR